MEERGGLLLMRIPVLRAASDTSPHTSLRLGRCILAVVVSHEGGMDVTE